MVMNIFCHDIRITYATCAQHIDACPLSRNFISGEVFVHLSYGRLTSSTPCRFLAAPSSPNRKTDFVENGFYATFLLFLVDTLRDLVFPCEPVGSCSWEDDTRRRREHAMQRLTKQLLQLDEEDEDDDDVNHISISKNILQLNTMLVVMARTILAHRSSHHYSEGVPERFVLSACTWSKVEPRPNHCCSRCRQEMRRPGGVRAGGGRRAGLRRFMTRAQSSVHWPMVFRVGRRGFP